MTEYQLRLTAVREELARKGFDGFLVPMADEYQSEYVPASAQRIAFLSGFTGSAGSIVLLQNQAAFFTDGRYTLQAEQQIPGEQFNLYDSADKTPLAWLTDYLKPGMKIGFDPWLHTASDTEKYNKVFEKMGAQLLPFTPNPIDTVWRDRPPSPINPILPHDLLYAGVSSEEKRKSLAKELKNKNVAAAIITDPASVAWLLNIRGGDVPNTPLPLSFAILKSDARVLWFVDGRKLTQNLSQHLGPDVVSAPPDDFAKALDELGQGKKLVRIDKNSAANWVVDRLRTAGALLDDGDDPCVLPRACKNPTELEGTRAAHRRDGVAIVKFLAWLDTHLSAGDVTEISAAEKLLGFRTENNLFRGPSFDTISGAGSHGAIVHYRAVPTTNRRLEMGQLYLLDSGGQYLDGTTDVTRTLALGPPLPEMCDRFTRVLKGHIALAAIRFPEGTTGSELDVLARQYLWKAGLDYSHGTGHGVGSYLGVHEGPHGISRRSKVPLRPGMIVSNEPGYYKNGHYGIRIENLQVVTPLSLVVGGERVMMGFETLTLVPIDRRLVVRDMLTEDERIWLNDYHAHVRHVHAAYLNASERDWLDAATAPL